MLASQKDLLQENLRLPRYERTGWIGVGLEGTLARSTPSADKGNIGPALAPMLRRVKHWLRSGRTVKIVTERAGDFADEHLIHLWCQRNGLPPLEITDHVDNQITIQAQYVTPDMVATSRDGNKSANDLRDRLAMWHSARSRAIPADASKVVQMPDGARLVGPTTFSLARWSKNDNLSNDFLGNSGWKSLRDAIQNIDPAAKDGNSRKRTGDDTKDAELTSLFRSGFTALSNSKEDVRGEEHSIEFRGGRAFKQTHPETFGFVFDPQNPETLKPGTPLQYLQRWRLFNELFPGADVRFEGVVMHSNGALSMKISQPELAGPRPTHEQISKTLSGAGWKKTAVNTWVKQTSRGEVMLTDAKPANFILQGDLVVPVDVITAIKQPQNAETFSLRPGDFASRVEAMFSPFQRSPEARLVMARVAKDRALRLGNELIEKANVIRTMGSIDREARVRAALAEDKAVQDYLDGLTPAARQTLEWQPADLQDDPLIAAMLDFGKLMSKSTALQRGKLDLKMGDFDGAPWLPPSIALWECRCVGVLHDLGYPVLPRSHGFLQRCWMAMMHVFRYPSRMRAEERLLGDCQVAPRRFSADLLRHGWHVRPALPAMPAPPIRWREEPG